MVCVASEGLACAREVGGFFFAEAVAHCVKNAEEEERWSLRRESEGVEEEVAWWWSGELPRWAWELSAGKKVVAGGGLVGGLRTGGLDLERKE